MQKGYCHFKTSNKNKSCFPLITHTMPVNPYSYIQDILMMASEFKEKVSRIATRRRHS